MIIFIKVILTIIFAIWILNDLVEPNRFSSYDVDEVVTWLRGIIISIMVIVLFTIAFMPIKEYKESYSIKYEQENYPYFINEIDSSFWYYTDYSMKDSIYKSAIFRAEYSYFHIPYYSIWLLSEKDTIRWKGNKTTDLKKLKY